MFQAAAGAYAINPLSTIPRLNEISCSLIPNLKSPTWPSFRHLSRALLQSCCCSVATAVYIDFTATGATPGAWPHRGPVETSVCVGAASDWVDELSFSSDLCSTGCFRSAISRQPKSSSGWVVGTIFVHPDQVPRRASSYARRCSCRVEFVHHSR